MNCDASFVFFDSIYFWLGPYELRCQLCFLALYTFVCGAKPLNWFNNSLRSLTILFDFWFYPEDSILF